MRRAAGAAALLIAWAAHAAAQSPATARPVVAAPSLAPLAGHWEGAFSREGAVQLCALDISAPDGTPLVATLDIPELGMFGEPLDECALSDDSVLLRCLYGGFEGALHAAAGEITAVNNAWGPPVRLHLKRASRPPELIVRREVRFDSAGADTGQATSQRAASVSLAGTLLLPVTASAATPAAGLVLMHGSDIGERSAWEYRGWGELLARQGVAVLIYDRRAPDDSFDDLAADALAALALLARQPEVRADRVGLLGASQSGWIAPLAATRSTDVAFLVLLSPPAVSVFEQELQRVEGEARAFESDDGATLTEEDVAAAIDFTQRLLAACRSPDRAAAHATLTPESSLARAAAWAPFVQIPDSAADLAWFAAHDVDPADTLAQVACPVLAFWGEKDVTVPPALNLPPLREALAGGRRPSFTAKVWPDCGHDLERRSALLGDDWTWPEHVWRWARKPPGLVDEIAAWIHAR